MIKFPSKVCNNDKSLVVRQPAFCICENKATDQLCGNRVADQRLCFHYIDTNVVQSPYFLNLKFQASFHLRGYTARFVSDLVGNPGDRFFHNEAHKICAKEPLCQAVSVVKN